MTIPISHDPGERKAPPLICLITPGHVASTPRLVKEADALMEAGYRVHVVAGRPFGPVDPLDAAILAKAAWLRTLVDGRRGPADAGRKLLREAARRLLRLPGFGTARIAARALRADAHLLAIAAARVPASLYIGHCLAGLAAAASAAAGRGARIGFDIEDFHDAETAEAGADPAGLAMARSLQSELLPRCSHVTVSAPLIGSRYSETYRVSATTVLNVFPLDQAPADTLPATPAGANRPAIAYWFSQTIGPGRGLEAAIAILGRMRIPAELHLRGFVDPAYSAKLMRIAAESAPGLPIRFLDPGPPSEMARLAAGADIGLSIEETRPANRDLCLTNKIFTYLLAGIPQLLSRTSAQCALAPELGPAALLGSMEQPEATARELDRLLGDAAGMGEARRHARALARNRFCWDLEKTKVLDSIGRAIGATA